MAEVQSNVGFLFGGRPGGDLSVMEIVVATVISRDDLVGEHESFLNIADICGRRISKPEVVAVMARLVSADIISGEGAIHLRKLTPKGVLVLHEAQKGCLRAFDRGPALFVFGEMISLFDHWSKERNDG